MRDLTEEEMDVWNRIGALMAEKPESIWDAAYVSDSLGKNMEAVTAVMDKMEYWQYTEDRIGEMMYCSGISYDTERIAFVLGEDEDYVEAILSGMEEQKMVMNVAEDGADNKMWMETEEEEIYLCDDCLAKLAKEEANK